MSKNRAAILGTGQTKYVAKRHDVTMSGMIREAIDAALADAQVSIDDIDAIVIGKAPTCSRCHDAGTVHGRITWCRG